MTMTSSDEPLDDRLRGPAVAAGPSMLLASMFLLALLPLMFSLLPLMFLLVLLACFSLPLQSLR